MKRNISVPDIRHDSNSLSRVVVRNILGRARYLYRSGLIGKACFDVFVYGRYVVTVCIRDSRCVKLIVRLYHCEFNEHWIVKPGEYVLLSVDAFNL